MDPKDRIKDCGIAVGCPNIEKMKKWYWSLGQGYVEENFLFLACAYYVVLGLERGERQGDRIRLLFDKFICSNYGPLYVNVQHRQRSLAQNVINANAYENYGYSLPALSTCVEEVSFMVQGKLGEAVGVHGSLPNSMKRYDNPRKKVETKWWQQRFFGAKKHVWIPTRLKTMPSEKIDMVMQDWGPAPWLYHLRAMS